MAEIGIIASVVQIADAGLRLSIKLCTFGEIVVSADKSIICISKDVSLASSVLKELGVILAKDKENKFMTETAVKTTDDVVKQCLQIFEEMEDILVKKLPNLRGNEPVEKTSKATILLERLKWPYLQPKLELLQSNLERLKSTILLMLNVITYARQVATKSEPDHIVASQRSLIEDLAQSNQDYIRKFEAMRLESKTRPMLSSAINSNVDGTQLHQPLYTSDFVQEDNEMKTQTMFSKYGKLFVNYTHLAENQQFTQLIHYLNLQTAILKEVGLVEYCIDIARRSRFRNAIHDVFDVEIHSLARPFGDDCFKLVKDYFASLITESRDRFPINPRRDVQQGLKGTGTLPKLATPQHAHGCVSQRRQKPHDSLATPYQSAQMPQVAPHPPPAIFSPVAKSQCWDHGCNGRQFTSFWDLLKHQQELSGTGENCACPQCGAEFTSKTARDGHVAQEKCKEMHVQDKEERPGPKQKRKRQDDDDTVQPTKDISDIPDLRYRLPKPRYLVPPMRAYCRPQSYEDQATPAAEESIVDQLVALWTVPSE